MRAHTGLIVLVIMLCLAGALGCSPPPEAQKAQQEATGAESAPSGESAEEAAMPEPAPQEPAEKYVIGMSQCNLGEPWRVQMNTDIRNAAAEHPNIEMVFKDAQNDTLVQVSHLEEFVSQGVDAIIISPKEAAPFVEPITRATQVGVPVIILDRAVPESEYTVFIGADNVKIGKAAGEWVRDRLDGEGRVIELMGLMTSVPGQDRHEGFLDGIAGSDIEVVFRADMEWLQDQAQQEMESALTRFDDIDLVYSHNDPGAYGAYLAAKAVGRAQEMVFVGIDGLPQEGQMYVREGILDVTFEYPTGGKEAIDTALAILAGDDVPKHITLDSRYYTRDNIDEDGAWLP
ncbi:MAG: substrate-binding domain-containing protein [Candidatus Hydrogenedentota bacterium]